MPKSQLKALTSSTAGLMLSFFFTGRSSLARISCKNLLAAGYTSSGSYSLKINGNSFQVQVHTLFIKHRATFV